MKKRLFSTFLFLLLMLPLYSALSPSMVFYADRESLISMCSMRGIEASDEEAMRNALYEYEGIEHYTEEIPSDSSYEVRIESADRLERESGIITISGNASLSFSDSGKGEKLLSAERIIVDDDNSRITALGKVSFRDKSENASLNEISAEIVTVFWKSGKVYVSDATTSSERKNSENDSVTFYTQGERLVYLPEGGILYENGYVSSNPEHRHSSLKAKELAMLPGGDMFVSDAYLSIGRVPVLYIPFFFFPGSRITGNPAFGFNSAKGAFLNTTFEILGINRNISEQKKSSSFSAILRSSDESGSVHPEGFYYDETAESELSDAEKWARKSGSYISLMGDVYGGSPSSYSLRNGGLMLGIDSGISLFNKQLTIKTFSAAASSSEVYSGRGRFRYFSVNSLKYSGDSGLSIDASFPLYSDNRVLIDFGNRLTGFSIDPILFQNPVFPSSYSSELSSISRELSLSYRLPSRYTGTLVSSFDVSALRLREQLSWDSSMMRDDRYTYKLDYAELPLVNLSVSGALFSFSGSIDEKNEAAEEKKSTEPAVDDPLLKPLYESDEGKVNKNNSEKYSASLKYSVTENAENNADYEYGMLKTRKTSSSTSSKFSFEGYLSSYFRITASFLPSYNYNKTENTSGNSVLYKEESVSAANGELSAEIPVLGLKYSLGSKLYKKMHTKSYSVNAGIAGYVTETDDSIALKWDKDTVTSHSISLSKSFTLGNAGSVTPSLSYVLPPLSGTLKPGLGYKCGAFGMQLAWKFIESSESKGDFLSDLIELSMRYDSTYFTASFAGKYQSRDYREDDFLYPFSMTSSLSLRTEDRKWTLTEYIDYAYFSGFRNNIRSLKTTAAIPYFEASCNWACKDSSELQLSDVSMRISLKSAKLQLWKGRIYFDFGLDSSLKIDLFNRYNSSFAITPSAVFSIAEFLDIKFSFTTDNNALYRYFDDDRFSFPLFFEDLGRSLDFFGDGRRHTSFILSNAKLEFVHYMEDWNLHCSYKADVVLSNNRYSLVPEFSIYLAWKTMPDLKVDQTWKKNDSTAKWEKQ